MAVNLPKSSAFRYLAALESRGYVNRADDGVGYQLSFPAPGAQSGGTARLERLIAVAKPLMERLTSADVPVSLLATLDGNGIRYLWVSTPAWADPRVPRFGDRELLHTTSVGKAIAAQLSDDAVLAMINATGMPRSTPTTLGSPTGLLRELNRIRERRRHEQAKTLERLAEEEAAARTRPAVLVAPDAVPEDAA